MAEGDGPPTSPQFSEAWSERTDLQVQKMEQTIEQDLAKAMVGLREQFRQHPRFGGPSTAVGGDPAGLEALQPEAALADFRCEAAAARDETLDGLARLRRELEAQRARQGSTASPVIGPGAADSSRQHLQLAAMEAALKDLRRTLSVQQGTVADLRRDVAAQSEQSKRSAASLDREVQRLAGELELLRDRQPPGRPEDAPDGQLGLLRQEHQHYGERLDRLEQLYRSSAEARAAVTSCLGVVSEMDARLRSVSSALEAERKARASRPAQEDPGELTRLQAELSTVRQEVSLLSGMVAGEQKGPGQELERTRQLLPEEISRLREALGGVRASEQVDNIRQDLVAERQQRSIDIEDLQRRLEDGQRASLASFQEMAEGLMLECTSRQAQISELRQSLADDVSASVDAAREALQATVELHCKDLRSEVAAQLEALERELRSLGAQWGEGGCQPQVDETAARLAAIEAEVGRSLAVLGQQLDAQGDCQQGAPLRAGHVRAGVGEEAPGLGEAELAEGCQRPLISRGLKASLEQLVDKVSKTLKPGMDLLSLEAAGPAQAGPSPTVRRASAPEGCSFVAGQARPSSPTRLTTQPPVLSAPLLVRSRPASVSVSATPHHAAYPHSVLVPGGAQVIVGSTTPMVAPPASAVSPVLVQHRAAPLTVHAPPPPVVVMPGSSTMAAGGAADATAAPTQQPPPPLLHQCSAGTFGRQEAGAGPVPPERQGLEGWDSKESFRRCLQELREENRALREGGGRPPDGAASVPFPTAAQHQAQAVQGPQGLVPGDGSGLQLPVGPPGPVYRTIAPAAVNGQRRAVSPTPAIRRTTSPQR